jgi:hypothetical protein
MSNIPHLCKVSCIFESFLNHSLGRAHSLTFKVGMRDSSLYIIENLASSLHMLLQPFRHPFENE